LKIEDWKLLDVVGEVLQKGELPSQLQPFASSPSHSFSLVSSQYNIYYQPPFAKSTHQEK
jgi:hypothetical protein